jgi:MbtH protein
MHSFDDEQALFHVVVNHEEQYSIWPADRELPAGWRAEGKSGTRKECLDHIERSWTDMRPLSLRRQMDVGKSG